MFSPAIQRLLKRRVQLNQEIEREQKALSPDWSKLYRLKKWRLAIKDTLQRMAFASPHSLPSDPAPRLIPAPVPRPAPRPIRDRRPSPQNA